METHDHDHDHDHEAARVSSPEERALLTPFLDDLHGFARTALAGVDGPIAEIGAGDGVLAERLRADGFNVVAIDAHEETAAAAQAQGRDVQVADWLTWDGGGHGAFAALLFTRSLHHIEPLDVAVAQMSRLAPGGLVIADEFGFELVDNAGAQFLIDAWALLAAAGLRDDDAVATPDPLTAWRQRMTVDHRVASSEMMLDAIATVANIEQVDKGLFMTQLAMWKVDPTHPRAAAVRDLLHEIEKTRLDAGTMTKAGIRLIARLHS